MISLKSINLYLRKILLFAGMMAVLSSLVLYKKWRDAETRAQQNLVYAKWKDVELTYYRNELGQEIAKKEAVVLEYKSFRQLSDDRHLQWLKQFESLKKNFKNLEVATNIQSETISDFKTNLKDTIIVEGPTHMEAFTFDNTTEWIIERGTIYPERKIVETQVGCVVPIQGVLYWKRNKVLGLSIGRKRFYFEATSPNPYTKITNAEQILIKKI